MPAHAGPLIILYDGVCGLCHRLVHFVLTRDRRDRFRFASLQSPFAATRLARHGQDPRDLDTLYVIVDNDGPSERLLSRARAWLFVLQQLGGLWRLTAVLSSMLPTRLLDTAYDLIARYRYRVFGQYQACPMPDEKWRNKFVET